MTAQVGWPWFRDCSRSALSYLSFQCSCSECTDALGAGQWTSRANIHEGIPPLLVAFAQIPGKTASGEMNKLTTLFSRLVPGFTVATLGFINTFAADSSVDLEKSEMQARSSWRAW